MTEGADGTREIASFLKSPQAARYFADSPAIRHPWTAVVDVAGRMVVTNGARNAFYVIAGKRNGFVLTAHKDPVDVMTPRSDGRRDVAAATTVAGAFEALVNAAGLVPVPVESSVENDRLELDGDVFDLMRCPKSEDNVMLMVSRADGRSLLLVEEFTPFEKVAKVLDEWLVAWGRSPATGYRGRVVELWDHETRDVEEIEMPTPGAFLDRYGCLNLSVEEVIGHGEIAGDMVLSVRDTDGNVLYDERDAKLASVGGRGAGYG